MLNLFHCPECARMIAVDRESLALELACPHCAKTVPVPWEDIEVEEQGQAKAAAPAAVPSLIAQVKPAGIYDFSRFHQLANALPELCAYTAVSKWNQEAKEEQHRIKEAFQTVDDALRPWVEAIAKLSLDLDRAKSDFKQQLFLKRISGDHSKEREITAQIADIEKQRGYVQAEKSRLGETSTRLQQLLGFTARFAPKSPAEKVQLIKELRQEKKEITAKKRETTMAMAAIRQLARRQSANVRSGPDMAAAAAHERRKICREKEAALAPLETTKAKLEHELMNLEKHLLWIERFE